MTQQHRSLDSAGQHTTIRRRHDASAEPARAPARPLHPLLTLQQQVGNSQIARMLAQREEGDDEVQASHDPALAQRDDEEEVQASHDPATAQRAEDEEVQASHDGATAQRAEEEEVQASHDPATAQRAEDEEVQASHDAALAQRQPEGEDDEQGGSLHRQPEVGLEGGPISGALSGRINSQRGGGDSLDEGTRTDMESAFGTSFANVRVHTGGEADTLNRSLSARAFTTGSDIFFRTGTYQPGSSDGRRLLSHELTHVVQQRSMSSSGPMKVSPAGDAHEQQADAVAHAVVSQPSAGAASTAQREVAQREDEAADAAMRSAELQRQEEEEGAVQAEHVQRAEEEEQGAM